MKKVSASRAFTLIELLIVISIIVILASLTLSTMKLAFQKGAIERARSEIKALGVALESYKADNGNYPMDVNTNDPTMDPKKADANGNPFDARINGSTGNIDKIKSASLTLYKELTGDKGPNPRQYGFYDSSISVKYTCYFPFRPNMLWPKCAANSTPLAVTALIDPFGGVYCYSTIGNYSMATTGTQNGGYNTTYDLWSTADYEHKGAMPLAKWIANFHN